MSAFDQPRELVVDGERWLVRDRPDGSGHTDLDWLTGPNAGYGFTMGPVVRFVREGEPEPPPYVRTEADVVAAIRDFLSSVDPATGYLPD